MRSKFQSFYSLFYTKGRDFGVILSELIILIIQLLKNQTYTTNCTPSEKYLI